jgi:hypothetical protein
VRSHYSTRHDGVRPDLRTKEKRPRLLGAVKFKLALLERRGYYFFFFGAAFFLAGAFFFVAFFIE